jgi:LacI family transcriptional regulator
MAMSLPTVVFCVNRQIPGMVNVVGDCVTSGTWAAEHLLDRGFQNFAYCSFGKMYWSRGRYESFRKRVAKAGFKTHFYEQAKARPQHSIQKELTQMADWLKSLPKPVGLMTCCDDCSLHIIEACKIAELNVPEQVAVIGVDNDEWVCKLSNPPLSSIALNFERGGYNAAELLDKLMKGKEKMKNQFIMVEPMHPVLRQSTDILAIEDTEVVNAVRYIRQHVKEPIQVSDVTRVTSLSRRSLERRFRAILGRSIHDEIRRVRAEQIVRMLIDTNLPVSRIALELGFPGVEHIARLFRKEKAMTPLAYRKQYGYR